MIENHEEEKISPEQAKVSSEPKDGNLSKKGSMSFASPEPHLDVLNLNKPGQTRKLSMKSMSNTQYRRHNSYSRGNIKQLDQVPSGGGGTTPQNYLRTKSFNKKDHEMIGEGKFLISKIESLFKND